MSEKMPEHEHKQTWERFVQEANQDMHGLRAKWAAEYANARIAELEEGIRNACDRLSNADEPMGVVESLEALLPEEG